MKHVSFPAFAGADTSGYATSAGAYATSGAGGAYAGLNPDCYFLRDPDRSIVEKLDSIIREKLNALPSAIETAKVQRVCESVDHFVFLLYLYYPFISLIPDQCKLLVHRQN